MAVLGLLNEAPMHGYELRKRLNSLFGWGRALSYGSLYPCLKAMYHQGWISEHTQATAPPAIPTVRRAKIVYRLTDRGEERFSELLAEGGPATWEDDNFGVHFAFFARTDIAVRLRILEGRRRRLEERLDRVRSQLERTQELVDAYAIELRRHDLESVEREVSWLSNLIASERQARRQRRGDAPSHPIAEPGTTTEPDPTWDPTPTREPTTTTWEPGSTEGDSDR
jgi:DNA-binding PadR family transcriptional regulator